MNKQWKIGLSVIALAAGFLMPSAYAANSATAASNAAAAANNNAAAATNAAAAKVNINTATANQLAAINGLNSQQAQAIVDYRQQNGPFAAVNDLNKVPGIDSKVLANVSTRVTVDS